MNKKRYAKANGTIIPLKISAEALELRLAAKTTDMHMVKAMEIFNCRYDEITPQMRKFAKSMNFINMFSDNHYVIKLRESHE